MSTIFISHSSSDNDAAEEFGQRLARQNHHSIFLDFDPEKGIVAGRSWERTLYRKLRACRAMLAICTDDYLSSKWCFAELALARMEGKHIVAVLVDGLSSDAKLPAILSEKQFIDLRSDREGGYERLWRALGDLDLLGLPGEWNPDNPPYLGLSAYQEEHAPVFFGREDETRAGVELLERGAPGLIMVLGASGSGKSSMVRAGIVPRLRRNPANWLIVGPFRPGRDPFAELSQSLVESFRRYAPDVAGAASNQQEIRARLERESSHRSGQPSQLPVNADDEAAEDRVRHLMDQIEAFQRNPPPATPDRLRSFLDWSLDDLRRIGGHSDATEDPHVAGRNSHPLVDLADELLRASGYRSARVLVIVDQFEELLGHDDPQQPSHGFLLLLRRSVEGENSPLLALGTMRSDFLGQFQRDPNLRGMDFESLSLGPMSVDGMRRVIEQPARLSALEFDEGLVERLLDDTETADALPLLSFTLSVLWRERQDDGRLAIRAYETLGGLQGAVAREADAVLAGARREGKAEQLRAALLRMARLNEDGSYARQPVHWSDARIREAELILEKLVDRRLLVTHGHDEARVVEVAHEALFRSWAPLRDWLESARAELLLQQQLRRDAATWHLQGRDPDTLWRGARLMQARESLAARSQKSHDETATRERAFIRAGLRRQRRRMAGLIGAIATVMVILTGALVYALGQAEEARRERRTAVDLARASRAGELLSTDPTKAVLMLREVEDPSPRFVAQRITGALRAPLVYLELEHETPTHHLKFSPDGRLLATLSDAGSSFGNLYQQNSKRVRLWDVQTGIPLTESIAHDSEINAVSFSRDSTLMATLAGNFAYIRDVDAGKRSFAWEHTAQPMAIDFDRGGAFALTADGEHLYTWDLASGQRLTDKAWESEADVSAVGISLDGRTVLIGKQDGSVKAWSLTTGVLWTADLPDGKYKKAVQHFYFNPNGKQLQVGYDKGAVRALAMESGSQSIQSMGPGNRVVFSPDGKLAVQLNQMATVWNTQGDEPYRPKGSRKDLQLDHGKLEVLDAVFHGGSSRFLTVSGHRYFSYWDARSDNMLRVWDLAGGEKQVEFQLGQEDELLAAAFAPNGETLATSAGLRVSGGRGERLRAGGTVRIWNLEFNGERFSKRIAASGRASSHDGRYLATVANKAVTVWSLDGPTPRPGSPFEHDSNVRSVAFSNDGSFVITTAGTRAHVWDRDSGQLRYIQPEQKHDSGGNAPYLRGHGVLLTRSRADEVEIRDLRNGQVELIGTVEHCASLRALRLNRHRTEALAVCGGSVQLWDLVRASYDEAFLVEDGQYIRGVDFSADGSHALIRSDDHAVRVSRIDSDAAPHALDHGQRVQDAIFGPSGKLVLTTAGNTSFLWDVASGEKLWPLEHPEEIDQARFTEDGRFVITEVEAGKDGDRSFVNVWDTDSGRRRFEARLAASSFDWSLGASGRTLLLWNESQVQGWTLETGATLFSEPLILSKPLLRDTASEIEFVHLSEDDGLLVTATSLESVIWEIGGDRLSPILDEVTTLCLSPGFRQANLGESPTVAQSNHGRCATRSE